MNDMAMFLSTLAAIVALGGVLYLLIRAELRAALAPIEARLGALEADVRPIKEFLMTRGLAEVVGEPS